MKTMKRGFTIVEITIAMTFVATLLITIALVVTQMTAIYQKGLALRAVNSTGRELVDEFTRGITSAPAKGVSYLCNSYYSGNETARTACEADGANLLTYHQDTARINDMDVPVHGVFCTGRYSYIWNTGYALKSSESNHRAELIVNGTNYGDKFRVMRVNDDDRALCGAYMNGGSYRYNGNSGSKYSYNISSDDAPIELLSGSESNLTLYDFVPFPAASHDITQHAFYSITFILGTIQGGINIMSTGDYCKAPATDSLDTEFNFCAVNKFSFAVRATGEMTDADRSSIGHY